MSQATQKGEMSESVSEAEKLTPPILSQGDMNGLGSDELTAGGKPDPITSNSANIADEIKALKAKLADLERQTNASRTSQQQDPDQMPPLSREQADREQYKRMEQFLYKHRRDWELGRCPPKDMDMSERLRPWSGDLPFGPWDMLWYLNSESDYERPDPFKLSNDFVINNKHDDPSKYGDYDRTIDYGLRRERVRKNFEWDLDRIFLAEEHQRREQERRQKVQEFQEKKGTPQNQTKEGIETKDASNHAEPTYATPRLNRVDWNSFKRLKLLKNKVACVMNILKNEPVIDDDFDIYETWFGSSNRRARKLEVPQDNEQPASMTSGQGPLPERISIRSPILFSILSNVLNGDVSSDGDSEIVFVRPFKALVYREQALRDWCSALEKKFATQLGIPEDSPRTTIGTSHHTEDEDTPISGSGEDAVQVVGDSKTLTDDSAVEVDEGSGSNSSGDDGLQEAEGDEDEVDENEVDEDPDDVTKSQIALEHLRCLLEFVDSEISLKRTYLKSPSCRKVFFTDLWYLFRPGVEVIGNDGKQAYRVISVNLAKHRASSSRNNWGPKKSEKADLSVACVYIDFDGTHLGPVAKSFNFKRYDGDKDITSLEIYPLRFHPARRTDFTDAEWAEVETLPQNEKYRRKLVGRGAKFLDVASVKHMYYAGPTLMVRDDVDSQVVIDFETALSAEEEKDHLTKPTLEFLVGDTHDSDSDSDNEVLDCLAACCRAFTVYDDMYVDEKQRTEYINSLLRKKRAVDEQPSAHVIPRLLKELKMGSGKGYDISEDELVIMSYRVFGFVLRSRRWAQLDISYLSEVHTFETPREVKDAEEPEVGTIATSDAPTAFERLVLEEGHQSMIVSLISQHFRDKESSAGQREQFDIVKGKGKGLILLLHGAPGVGKTSTAEGVAELFQKPLFQITCGDLGVTAKEVEKALETNFALASKWGCILLLDEADVFLAERTKEDFKRNGLVAVFLRVLEYYSGILFLTTNRVGDFDEAFASRIHISLYYPELNREKTGKVFKLNMDMIQERFERRGRRIKIETLDVINFAYKHFDEHPNARWNGRQIRNACQTALALAEFHAQGESSKAILNPDAVITLDIKPFEIVRNAYLQFTKYMHDLYGTNNTRRAKDGRLRAIRVDENDGIVRASNGNIEDWKKSFLSGSQGQQRMDINQTMQQPHQSLYQAQSLGHSYATLQQPQAYIPQQTVLPHIPRPQPGSAQLAPSAIHQPQPQYSQAYANAGYTNTNPGGSVIGASIQGPGELQNPTLQQAPPTSLPQPLPLQPQLQPQSQPQTQPQQPPQPAWSPGFNQDTQPQYGLYSTQMPPTNTTPR